MRRDGPVALQSNAIKEAQSADHLIEITPGDVSFINQIYLVLTNLFCPEQLRRLAEVPGKVSDTSDIDFDGMRRSIAYPKVVDHALTKSSHKEAPFKDRCSFGDKHYALTRGAFFLLNEM